MQPDQNQYNFIINPETKSTGPAFLQDPKKRTFFAVAFVVIVIMIVVLVVGIIMSATSGSNSSAKDVVAYQTEILRVSEIGLKDSTDNATKAKIASLKSFISSDLAQTSTIAPEMSKEELAKYKDENIDKALVSAKATNTFDQVIITEIDKLLETYQQKLETTFNSTSNEDSKLIIQTANKNIVVFKES